MSDLLSRIKEAKRLKQDTFYEAANGHIIERNQDGTETPTGYYLDGDVYKEVTAEDTTNAENPPNLAVVFIFFGMLILLGLCIAYFFWPKDTEDTVTPAQTELIKAERNV